MQQLECNYFWIRIYDYQEGNARKQDESDCAEPFNYKGTLLDEYYLFGEALTRTDCKEHVVERSGATSFAKPRKGKSGTYALILESDKFFYDRFYKTIDTYCFNCGKHIEGKAKDFPHIKPIDYGIENKEDTEYYFCSYDCKRQTMQKLKGDEGEWQVREDYTKNGIYGYIYHIYNRIENKHYIGQTRYMPFFRWQEHAKQHIKGDLCDLVFETVAEVRKSVIPNQSDQDYLNSIEAWWIQKYIEEYGKENVMNLVAPKITIEYLAEQYNRIVLGMKSLFSSR